MTVVATRRPISVGLAGAAAAFGKVLQLATTAFVGISLPLLLSVSDVGVFFFIQSIVAIGAVVSLLGLHHTIPSLVGRAVAEGDSAHARALVGLSLKLCLASGVAIGCSVAAVAYSMPALVSPLVAATRDVAFLFFPLILITASVNLLVEIQRTVYAVGAASFLPVIQNLGLSLFVVVALALSWRPMVATLLIVGLLGLGIACVWGAIQIGRLCAGWPAAEPARPRAGHLLAQTWPNLVSTVSFIATLQADVWVVGLNGHLEDVGQYGIATRISGLLGIPLTVISLTILPHIVSNWTLGRRRYLQWILRLSATASTFGALFGFSAFALLGQWAISRFFGPSYLPAFAPALILCAGQSFFSIAGVAGYVLIMLGRQKLAMSIMLAIGVATVLIAIPAMRLYGITGVACVYACSAAIQAGANIYFVRRCFGLRSVAALINPLRALKLLTRRN